MRTDDLQAIWNEDRLFADLRDRDHLKGSCGRCAYRYCGGCRARANGYLDDPFAPDPGCIRNASLHDELMAEARHFEGQEMIIQGR